MNDIVSRLTDYAKRTVFVASRPLLKEAAREIEFLRSKAMPVVGGELPARIAAALGVERCQSLCIRMEVGNVVTVNATTFASEEQLARAAEVLERKEYTLVEKDRLRGLEVDAAKWRESNAG